MQTKHFNKVTCFGSGFVGTPTTAVLALKNPQTKFYVYDINKALIEKWNNGCPIYEEGLQEIIDKVRNVNLFFTSDQKTALEDVDVIYIAVATPTKTFGEGIDKAYDLSYIESVARSISYFFKNTELKREIVVLEKSTVPVFTHKAVSEILRQNQSIQSNKDKFIVISNPEFLAEGTTIRDLLNPDRIVYGSCDREDVINKLATLHPHVSSDRIIKTSTISSEMSKLVANCFLSQRISSINSIALLIQKIGGDVGQIKRCIGADSRIGDKFINASVGFGGSCFKKDLLALIYLAQSQGLTEVADYWYQVVLMNEFRKKRFFNVILEQMYNTVRNKKFAVLGLSFKKGTNDVRDSAAAKVCELLLEEGAILQIFDPMIKKDKFVDELKYQRLWKDCYNERLIDMNSAQEAIEDTHAIVVLTEWDEFVNLDYASFYRRMHKPSYIFDGRNILKESQVKALGFKYFRIGHKH